MKALSVDRASLSPKQLCGAVLVHDLRDAAGRVAFPKGHVILNGDLEQITALEWASLHVIRLADDELHEQDAGARLARVAAGKGVAAGACSGGHWPLTSQYRGVLEVRQSALLEANRLDGIAVYSVYDGQVVDAGETVARAKIVPFAIPADTVARVETIAADAGGLVAVRAFTPLPVGAVVQESLGARAMTRFREAFGEKIAWFGSPLVEPFFVPPSPAAVADALSSIIDQGARVVALAGSRPMDPLDPAFDALGRLGATLERHGVPAHPGSLLWLARLGEIPIVGMPSCGLFSQATVFDLVLTRLLVGDAVDAEWLASLGHGGFLTRDMAFRFPPYRASRDRGEVA